MTEGKLVADIIRAIYPIVRCFRINVGTVTTNTGHRFSTGAPKGYPDISGYRRGDGRAVLIEAKLPYNRASEQQPEFIEAARGEGAIAGVCTSVEEALKLVTEGREVVIQNAEGGGRDG